MSIQSAAVNWNLSVFGIWVYTGALVSNSAVSYCYAQYRSRSEKSRSRLSFLYRHTKGLFLYRADQEGVAALLSPHGPETPLVTLLTSLEFPRNPCSKQKEYFFLRSAYGVWSRITGLKKTCKTRTKCLCYSRPCRKDIKIISLGFSLNSRTVWVTTWRHSWHWLPSMGDSVTARHRAIPEDKVRIFQHSPFLYCNFNVTHI